MRTFLTALSLSVLLFSCSRSTETSAGGLSPQDALKTFQLPEGYKIELVAAEPLISDPVAMEVDEQGNMYIVELHGYPLDTAGSGVIKLLVDTNGDGMPDKSTVFADHLKLPTGIMRWKNGFMVVDVPDVLYLEDTDHDGKADIRKVMLTGVALTNPQHIANTPIFGLDNWIYLAHMGSITPKVSMMFSDSGHIVRYADDTTAPQLPRNADGRNIRFNPDTYTLEMCSGETQYGHTFDNWGHHFCVENADHIFVEAIAAKYLQQNPDLLISDASDYISDHGDASKVFPITTNPENQLLTDVGVITSACGITWYNGGLFPDSFNNVSLTCEPQSNIIHADKVTQKGASFNAARVYEDKEFLASTDAWFRPVMMYVGPDGALYVMDYYRQIIEHPEWLSDSVINSGALYNGHDKGRIYRVTPANAAKMNWCSKLNLAGASTEQLVQYLTSGNIWWRRNAQRLLMDRKDPQTAALLLKLIDTTKSATAIVHALWSLEGMHIIDIATLNMQLHNPVAGVRENAVKIAELHLKEVPQLEKELLALQDDTDAKVRYQMLCTLGDIHDAPAESAKQKILMKDIDDKWLQVAALAAAHGKEYDLLKNSIAAISLKPSDGKALFFANCAGVIGLSQRIDDIKNVIALATKNNTSTADWWQSACLKGLSTALPVKGLPSTNFEAERSLLLSKFDVGTTPLLRTAAIELLMLLGAPQNNSWAAAIAQAKAVAADGSANINYRKDAVRLLSLDKEAGNAVLFDQIISNVANDETLIQTAIKAFNNVSPDSCSNCIVRNWKSLGYNARETAMQAFLSSTGNTKILLSAIQQKQILPTAISWPHMVDLMNNDDAFIRNRSRDLLAAGISSREETIKKYQTALTLKADTSKGLLVFKTICATCHNINGRYGHSFGPDLGTVRNRDAGSIMTDILNPNRSIATTYDLWIVTKKNGEKFSGIISAQTPASVTLNNIGGLQTTVARSDIRSMEISQTSAMPIGLETSINQQQMSDLLGFIKNSR
ncbi:dehydrogenase [Panacibacter ginsenosidivorans]|uniref:Dehydrogenase n=1 Tax=Panacibacter ginsenosidivorans TaxID=1813871 RepID=A0A5B8V782_9BACT|nr:PVC-type heme-binding CxxCH protein [Panacibacter ginsenosidivorans]QEC66763.1 dehydrogenase [Panacibacter ginsenosidivorans]